MGRRGAGWIGIDAVAHPWLEESPTWAGCPVCVGRDPDPPGPRAPRAGGMSVANGGGAGGARTRPPPHPAGAGAVSS